MLFVLGHLKKRARHICRASKWDASIFTCNSEGICAGKRGDRNILLSHTIMKCRLIMHIMVQKFSATDGPARRSFFSEGWLTPKGCYYTSRFLKRKMTGTASPQGLLSRGCSAVSSLLLLWATSLIHFLPAPCSLIF